MREKIDHFNKMMLTVVMTVLILIIVVENLINQSPIGVKDYLDFASKAITVTTIVGLLYDKWIWKWDPFVKTPKLFRRYTGIMHSDYNGSMDIPDVILDVNQSYFHVSVKMKTRESWSRSIASSIDDDYDSYRLTYTYINEPKADYADRSTMHYGTATFTIDDPAHITGNYYTNRKTIGSMDLVSSGNIGNAI